MTEIDHHGHRRLGVEALDQDHEDLDVYLRDIKKALFDDSYDSKLVKAAFNDLLISVKAHFRREEAWMKLESYPGIKVHSRQHQKLIKAVEEFIDRFQEDPTQDAGRFTLDVLQDCLVSHTSSADRVIGGFMGYKNRPTAKVHIL